MFLVDSIEEGHALIPKNHLMNKTLMNETDRNGINGQCIMERQRQKMLKDMKLPLTKKGVQ